jgi:hypothetical protein
VNVLGWVLRALVCVFGTLHPKQQQQLAVVRQPMALCKSQHKRKALGGSSMQQLYTVHRCATHRQCVRAHCIHMRASCQVMSATTCTRGCASVTGSCTLCMYVSCTLATI